MRCRLCLVDCIDGNVVDLFHHGEESNLAKLIAKYIHLEITQQDAFSTVVCESCFQHLNEFHNFILLVEQRQTELRNEFLEVKCAFTDKMDDGAIDVRTEHNEESLFDIENVMIEHEEHGDALLKEEFGLASDNNVNANEEENDEAMNFADNTIPITNDDGGDDDDDDEVPLQTLSNKIESSKKSTQLKEKNTKFKLPSGTLNKKRGRPRKHKAIEEIKPKVMRPNILTEEVKKRDEQILKSIRLKCDICNTPMSTLSELKKHFREVHNSKAYVLCCGRRFMRRFVLLDHLRYHLNPEHFKCEICNKVLKSKSCLENHHANMHSDTMKRKHECQICKKRFAHISNLNSHMITHESARDHICEICNKGFKSANLLKNHVTYVHENKQLFVCEICGQKYKFKPAFKRHIAEHDAEPNQLTEECPICKKWFRPNGLRFHIGRHDLEDVECETCGKVVKSKLALKSHIKYWHTKKEILKCNFCDKTFKRSSVLKEHIAMHTGQKDYNCPHCPREFRSKANMYAHIKKNHKEQWMQAQNARTRETVGLAKKQE